MNPNNLSPDREFSIVLSREAVAKERRTSKRYRCSSIALARLHLVGAGTNVEAWACNLSEEGVGLNLPYPLEVGATLAIRMRGCQPVPAVVMPARVVHATKQADGTWRIGCEFVRPLEPDTLDALL